MDDDKIDTLDKVSVLRRGQEDDRHLSAIFSSNLQKKTPSENIKIKKIVDISE